MPDSLRRMIDRADKAKATPSRLEPERLILPPRPDVATRRICFDCRLRPTLKDFTDRWLRDNPPPPARCVLAGFDGYVCWERKEHGRICDNCVDTGRRLHLATMQDASDMWTCPACSGRLVEVTQ